MSHFIFKAKKANGEIYTGTHDGRDRYEIYRMLRESGDELISYTEKNNSSFKKIASLNLSFGVKTHDKIIFARSLASMIQAGLPLSHALAVLERQSKSVSLKKVIKALNDGISQGQMFSQALAMHPKVFSHLFVSMVKAGEQSGALASSLKSITSQMESTYNLQRKVRGAMIYPAIIFSVMILIGILMLTYVVPTLTKTFKEIKVELPAATRFVLFLSDTLRNHGFILLIVIAAAVACFYFWARSKQGKKVIHFGITKIPVIGEIVREVNSARTARTLSSLIDSGVDVVESIRITKEVLQNIYYKRILENVEEAVNKGEPISKVFSSNTKFYPVFLGEMVAVGEETGKIGEMLANVATFYEDDVTERTKDMSTIIEPFLMVIIGAGVGFFALAMISPMYSLVNVI
jgi:type IV pilus assembly protein PilC